MSNRWFYRAAYWRGMKAARGVAALVLATSSVGFGALARDTGFDLPATLICVLVIWALPGQVILVSMMAGKASLAAATLAVTLSSVRLMPMVTSLLPVLRTKNTPRWPQALVAQMIAATTWLEARRLTPEIDPEHRISFTLGHGSGLMVVVLVTITGGYLLAGALPSMLSGTLMFLIPIYFLTALFIAAVLPADYLAVALGVVLGPLFALVAPELDLMFAGLIGGTLAFVYYKWRKKAVP
jgi:predicted branched-subunit amino acid permease